MNKRQKGSWKLDFDSPFLIIHSSLANYLTMSKSSHHHGTLRKHQILRGRKCVINIAGVKGIQAQELGLEMWEGLPGYVRPCLDESSPAKNRSLSFEV